MPVPNEGKELNYARVVGRSSTHQLDQVCKSRWRLQTNTSQPEPVLSLFDLLKYINLYIFKGGMPPSVFP